MILVRNMRHVMVFPHTLNSVLTLNFTLFHTFNGLYSTQIDPQITDDISVITAHNGLFWHYHVPFRPKPLETPLKFTG